VAAAFGFLYGSVFGFEDVLPALWIRPMDNIMQILIVAIVVLGVPMVLANLLNDWKQAIAETRIAD